MTTPFLAPLEQRLPIRARHWRLATRTLHFGRLPLLMGILNVTPDSFSDAGRFLDPQVAVDRARQLVAEGADILDIGGESTRPYSQPISADEELERVMPVVEQLCGRVPVPLSIDTSKAVVAKAAVAVGCEIINDVTGLDADPNMIAVAIENGVGVCAMHMKGTPQTMQDNPVYADVVAEIHDYLKQRRDQLVWAGLEPDRICLDPGIGFGKTHHHNLTLLANAWRFHDLGCPLLIGHSRKGFIAKILGDKTADRTPGTIGVALSLALQGVQIIRVHDVAPVHQALLLFEAAGGIDGQPAKIDAGDPHSPPTLS